MSGVMHTDAGLRARERDGESVGPWDRAIRTLQGAPSVAAMLHKTIESEVIPRLMLLNQAQMLSVSPSAATRSVACVIDEDTVRSFADILVHHSPAEAVARVRGCLAQGTSSEALLLDLLAPAANLLGARWQSDEISFTDVSSGLSRLHQILRMLSQPADPEDVTAATGSILLAVLPGERHVFGLAMVEEFFRDAGWSVAVKIPADMDELFDLLRTTDFDVLGLSLARQELQKDLSSTIDRARRESRNGRLQILVGGPLLVEHPELCAAFGADATAVDARQAVIEARSLLRLPAIAR